MTNTAVKEKVRVNDTEFEITLKPVLPQTENDQMVLDQPLPTPAALPNPLTVLRWK